jgi:hypothetical protein
VSKQPDKVTLYTVIMRCTLPSREHELHFVAREALNPQHAISVARMSAAMRWGAPLSTCKVAAIGIGQLNVLGGYAEK